MTGDLKSAFFTVTQTLLLRRRIRVNTVSFGAVGTPVTGSELAVDGGLAQI